MINNMSNTVQEKFHKEYIRRPDGVDLYKTIRPGFMDFHRLTVKSIYEYPLHIHNTYEVIWIENGPYFCSVNGKEIELNNGQVLVVKPGDHHQDHLKEGQSHYVLHFTLNETLFTSQVKPSSQIGTSLLENAQTIFRDMEREFSFSAGSDRFTGSLLDALLETLFWRIIRILPETALSATFNHYSKGQEFVSRLFKQFSESLHEPVSVEVLAAKMGLSKRTLSLYCRKYLDNSPGRLFLNFRIEMAQELLTREDMTIKEISYQLGFDTPFNFSRAFKRVTGICPSAYLQSL